MSWWGRSNDQNYAYYSVQGGTQTVNGVVAGYPIDYWGDVQDYQGSTTNGYWTDPNAGNLLARWDMERVGTLGTVTKDNGTNAWDITIDASVAKATRSVVGTNVNGRVDRAFNYIASLAGNCLTLADKDALSFCNAAGDTPFTISAWINPNTLTASTGYQIVTKFGTGREYQFFAYGSYLYIDLVSVPITADIGRYSAAGCLVTGQWQHVVATYSGNKATSGITLYKSGVRVDVSNLANGSYTGMVNTTTALYVGVRPIAGQYQWFDGQIDDVRIYNYEMASNDVLTLYQKTIPTNNVESRALQTKYTLGNGNVAAFGDVKVWSQYGDPATNFYGQATNWGWDFCGNNLSLWSNSILAETFTPLAVCNNTAPNPRKIDGTNVNGTPSADGTKAYWAFGGTATYIDYGDNFDVGTSNITCSAWIYWFGAHNNNDSAGTKLSTFISKGILAASAGYGILMVNQSPSLQIRNSGSTKVTTLTSTNVFTSNVWYHVVGTFDRTGNAKVYANGIECASTSITNFSGENIDTTFRCSVASRDNNGSFGSPFYNFTGRVGLPTIWPLALTSNEVFTLYTNQKAMWGY